MLLADRVIVEPDPVAVVYGAQVLTLFLAKLWSVSEDFFDKELFVVHKCVRCLSPGTKGLCQEEAPYLPTLMNGIADPGTNCCGSAPFHFFAYSMSTSRRFNST